nr:DNA-directed RNA polymerase I subunit 1 [Ipomoea batatas]
MVSGKTLPCFPPWDFTARAGGFISDRFLTGLRPQEYYFHCMAGREGLVDTAVKTSRSGYLQRCLIKNLESLKVCYDYTVRDADGSIIQFYYGEDGIDVHRTSFLKNFKALQKNEETIRQKFHPARQFNSYIEKLPNGLEERVKKFWMERKAKLNEKSKKSLAKHVQEEHLEKQVEQLTADKKKLASFLKLVEQKYLFSLVQAGEPVGVIAGQSIGEPSTQMTLNTFHLAGRGEMNVTLGIPRLQEILMTASDVIKTPFLSCPFRGWTSRDDAQSLLAKVNKITVADMIESMEVHLLPISIHNKNISQVYKLIVKLKKHDFVSLEDCKYTLKSAFLRELEDAIENHLSLLSKISGIKNFKSSAQSVASNETDENASGAKSQEDMADDDDGDDEDDRTEDLGSDAQKRKQQATDEMDYDDGSDNELSEMKNDETDDVNSREEEAGDDDDDDEDDELRESSKPKSSEKKTKSTTKVKRKKEIFVKKESDRAIFVGTKGSCFEVQFRFTNEPHILLAQVAQKTAKKVYIKSSGKIHNCRMVKFDVDENTVLWDGEKKEKAKRLQNNESKNAPFYWALKAAGVDFGAFWELQDVLDVNRIYSNNIHAMLQTFGVEAARASLIREVKTVFGIYGVEIDFRHLSLIADYMTHNGGYQPMSRHGRIADSLSPFLKMSFETASKFIVEAASHGMTDNLEAPSSRICLGLPVKMGTGSFDLMQKLEIDAQ